LGIPQLAIRPSGYFACGLHGAEAVKPSPTGYFSAQFPQSIQHD
jgi:hypothetical protein